MTRSLLSCLPVLLFSLISFSRINGYPSDFFKDRNDPEEEEEEPENVWPFGVLVEENKLAPQREEILQKMQEILGIRSQSEIPSHRKVLPQFMIELYNIIADSNGVTRELNPYNAKIVRSFIEKDSSLPHFYFFNISGLEKNESVLGAELHLYKKENIRPLRLISPYYLVKVFQVLDNRSLDMPHLHRLLNVRYVDAQASGWQVFNVKQAVLEWMNGEPNLGLLVVTKNLFEDDIDIDFSRRNEYHHNKQPILVLFDDDNTEHYFRRNITSSYYAYDNDENKKYLIYEDERSAEEFDLEDNYNRKYRHKRQQGQLEEVQLVDRRQPEFFQRQKRKRVDKFNFPDYYQREYILHETLKRRRRDAVAYKKLSPEIVSENTRITRILSSMSVYERAQFRERLGKTLSNRSAKQRRERRSLNNDQTMQQNVMECTRYTLYVDFEDIGLSSFIVAPPGYSAYQCKGVCEAPLSQDQHPSNHATIQAMIHKMNLTKDVERACCVPTKLSSLNILFLGEDQNAVLKRVEDMVVDQCGCR